MFVLRSSIPLQVSKKVLGIINKQRSAIKHIGGGGGGERAGRNEKINNRVGSFLALKSNINKNVWKILSSKSQRIKNTNLVNENELFQMLLNNF